MAGAGMGGMQRSARPSTAQRRPPKIKDNSTATGKTHTDAVAVGVMKEGSAAGDSDSDNEGHGKGDAGDGFGFGRYAVGAVCVVGGLGPLRDAGVPVVPALCVVGSRTAHITPGLRDFAQLDTTRAVSFLPTLGFCFLHV